MSDNKRAGRGGKGYYIALILCAAAIGITGYVYYRNTNLPESVSQTETAAEAPALGVQPEDVPVIATQPPKASTGTAPAATTPPAVKKELQTMSPVSGENIFGYSMEALSYNETTRDWRTHNGLDLAAEEGAPVGAAADGTVYTTYEDDALGYTVVIRHSGGYTTRYSSLREDLCVAPGDTVTLGQTIGYAADTALLETVMGSHVHFSVSCQDQPIDPADFLNLS